MKIINKEKKGKGKGKGDDMKTYELVNGHSGKVRAIILQMSEDEVKMRNDYILSLHGYPLEQWLIAGKKPRELMPEGRGFYTSRSRCIEKPPRDRLIKQAEGIKQ